MRFNGANVLLSLAALGSLPTGLGRAVPNSALQQYNGNYARAAPVHIEPVEPVTSKGGSTTKSGDDSSDGETSTTHIGTDSTSSTSSTEGTVHIGADDSNTVDLWCRGSGCGGGKETTLLTNDQLTTRGTKGVNLASNPTKGTDYSAQEKANYKISKEDFEGVDDSIPQLGYKEKYGLDADDEDLWQTVDAQSKDNPVEAVAKMSIGRATKDGKDYVAFVAHARFASADGNRYKLTASGDNVKDANGNLVANPDAATKAVPASQLVYDAAKQSGKLDGTAPEKILLVSENVINEEAKVAIPAAHKAMGKTGQALVLKKGASGVEGEQFNILAGTDNNYSYLNTVGRNPDTFQDYEVVSIETRDTSPLTMSIELGKKA